MSTINDSYMSVLKTCPLFENIHDASLELFLHSSPTIIKTYKKGSFIAITGSPMEGIGIMLEGHALLVRENIMGQRSIMTDLFPSSMFGEALLFTGRPLWPATIQATSAATVLFIPLPTFTTAFPECQSCQIQMLSNLLKDMSEKAIQLTRKVHYLTLKGMREKIFAYLIDMQIRFQSNTFILPHNRQEMADILNVSRTALSRELSRLQDDKIIQFNGKELTLLDLQTIKDYAF